MGTDLGTLPRRHLKRWVFIVCVFLQQMCSDPSSREEVIRDAVLYVLEAGLGPGKVSPKARRCFIVMLIFDRRKSTQVGLH